MTNSAEEQLSQGYRVIRLLAGDPESPWKGSLVCGPSGEMGVMVDAALLGATWQGWGATAAGHVLGPLDLLRRPDGHDVLLPVCTERVDDFLLRRAAGGAELTAGEGVTVAVSLLRGLGELHGMPTGSRGAWWLTDAGRPVFATGTAHHTIEDATIALLARLARDVPILADALEDVIAAPLDRRSLARELERCESMVFAIAEPLPLATTNLGPRNVRAGGSAQAPSIENDLEPSRRPWQLSLARHVDADWADLLSRTTTGLWRMVRKPRTGGRRPWLVAGGIAGVIVIGGLMWPTTPSGPATADVPPSATTSPIATRTPAAVPDDEAGPSAPDTTAATPAPPPAGDVALDLASVTGALLTSRLECGADAGCLEEIQESPDAAFPPGVIDLPPDERTVTLLDEFGGAAVVRVEGAEATPQLVVIVRAESRWLLRDVYDVAGQ